MQWPFRSVARWIVAAGLVFAWTPTLPAQNHPFNYNFERLSHLKLPAPPPSPWFRPRIASDDGYVYVADSSINQFRLRVLDVRDPMDPRILIDQFVAVEGSPEIGGRVQVARIHAANSFVGLTARETFIFYHDRAAGEMRLVLNSLVADLFGHGNLFVLNFGSLNNRRFRVHEALPGSDTLRTVSEGQAPGYPTFMVGRKLYYEGYGQGDSVVDIGTPSGPIAIANMESNPKTFGTLGFDYHAVLDLSDPMQVTVGATFITVEAVSNGVGFGFENASTIGAVDVLHPDSPDFLLGSYRTNGFSSGSFSSTILTASGDLVYVLDSSNNTFSVLRYTGPFPSQPMFDAEFISADLPSTLAAGQSTTATVTVRNTGALPWGGSFGFKLGLTRGQEAFDLPFLQRVDIPEDVSVPGNNSGTHRFEIPLQVKALVTPGPVELEFQLVFEGVEFFGETLSRVIQIVPPGADSSASDWLWFQ